MNHHCTDGRKAFIPPSSAWFTHHREAFDDVQVHRHSRKKKKTLVFVEVRRVLIGILIHFIQHVFELHHHVCILFVYYRVDGEYEYSMFYHLSIYIYTLLYLFCHYIYLYATAVSSKFECPTPPHLCLPSRPASWTPGIVIRAANHKNGRCRSASCPSGCGVVC